MRGAVGAGGRFVALVLAVPLAHAQVSNAPLHPSPSVYPPQPAPRIYPVHPNDLPYPQYPQYPLAPATSGWGMQGRQLEGPGRATPGVADKYPSDRSPALDNRVPTLRPVVPDLRDTTLRLGSPLDNAAHSAPVRRPEGLQVPLSAGEPERRGLRY